jgi:hypothetical protein
VSQRLACVAADDVLTTRRFVTASRLSEYEDVLGERLVSSTIAVFSFYSKVCSRLALLSLVAVD